MILIVAHHFALHGYNLALMEFSDKKILLDFLVMGGKIGVNIYIIISSYYICDRTIKYNGLFKLVCKVKCYSLFFLLIAIIFNHDHIGYKSLIKSIFPILFQTYWFITGYVILYLFAPYLNIFLKTLNKNTLKEILFLLILLYVILDGFFCANLFNTSLIWFIVLYITTYYIKYYVNLRKLNIKKLKKIELIGFFCIYLGIIIFEIIGIKIEMFKTHTLYFIKENNLLIFILSFTAFLIAITMKNKTSRLIDFIASGTLGIYLVHENLFLRDLLYQVILKNSKYLETNLLWFLFHCLYGIVFVYLFSFITGKGLDYLFKITVMKYFEFEKFEKLIKRIKVKINKYLKLLEKNIKYN